MIDDLHRSLDQLLQHELHLQNGEVEISFSQPNGDWQSRLGNLTLNLFLYDVRENAPLRRQQWQQVNGQGQTGQRVQLKRTPLMMDCFYLVSAWSTTDERARPLQEHWLLSRALLALARYPVLNPERTAAGEAKMMRGRRPSATARPPATFLVERLAQQEIEIRTRLAHHDVMTNPAEVWSALENQMRAGFSYVVTLPLDPWNEQLQEANEVRTWIARVAATAGLRQIGGVVRDGANERASVANVQAVLMETALYNEQKRIGFYQRTRSDARGRFRFTGLLPGAYTLLVGPDVDDPQAVRHVTLPAPIDGVPNDDEVDAAQAANVDVVINEVEPEAE